MSLSSPRRIDLLNIRRTQEEKIREKMIHPGVYVCPFIGLIGQKGEPPKTGCLVHPVGSPHPEIRKMKDPQNVSIYGASICAGYDCHSKETFGALGENSPFCRSSDLYRKVAPNHNLRKLTLEICAREKVELSRLEEAVADHLEGRELPVTSFDMPLSYECYDNNELWSVLGTLVTPKGYLRDQFIMVPEGEQVAAEICKKVTGRDVQFCRSKQAV